MSEKVEGQKPEGLTGEDKESRVYNGEPVMASWSKRYYELGDAYELSHDCFGVVTEIDMDKKTMIVNSLPRQPAGEAYVENWQRVLVVRRPDDVIGSEFLCCRSGCRIESENVLQDKGGLPDNCLSCGASKNKIVSLRLTLEEIERRNTEELDRAIARREKAKIDD